jgi:hypothetical protein
MVIIQQRGTEMMVYDESVSFLTAKNVVVWLKLWSLMSVKGMCGAGTTSEIHTPSMKTSKRSLYSLSLWRLNTVLLKLVQSAKMLNLQ